LEDEEEKEDDAKSNIFKLPGFNLLHVDRESSGTGKDVFLADKAFNATLLEKWRIDLGPEETNRNSAKRVFVYRDEEVRERYQRSCDSEPI